MVKLVNLKHLVALVPLAIAGLTGCEGNTEYHGAYEGHYVNIIKYSPEKTTHLSIFETGKNPRAITAIDSNSDGRFDKIEILVPKGSELERLANLQLLDEICSSVVKIAEDTPKPQVEEEQ